MTTHIDAVFNYLLQLEKKQSMPQDNLKLYNLTFREPQFGKDAQH